MNKILSPHKQTLEKTHNQQTPQDTTNFSSKTPLNPSDFNAAQMQDLEKAATLALEIYEGKYDRQYTLWSESKLWLTDLIKSNIVPKPGKSVLKEIMNHFRFVRKGKNVELTYDEKSIFSVELTQEQMNSPDLAFSITYPDSTEWNIWFSILTPDEAWMNGKVQIITREDFFKNFTFFDMSFANRVENPLLNSFWVSIDEKNKEQILQILNQSTGAFKWFKSVKLFAHKYSIVDIENLEFHFVWNTLCLWETNIVGFSHHCEFTWITIRPDHENKTQIQICVSHRDKRPPHKSYSQIKTYTRSDFIQMMKNAQKIKA